MAICDAGGQPAVLLTVDLTGISDAIVEAVARELQPQGVTREPLVVFATHTHTAPMLEGVLETVFGQPVPPAHREAIARYTALLSERLVEVPSSR